MLARIGLWLLKLGLIMILLAYEQALSIPYLTLIATIIMVQNQSPVGRQLLLVVIGLCIATVYVLPLGLGIFFVWMAAFGWKKAEYILKADLPRLLLISLVVAAVIGIVSQVQWTWTQTLFVVINTGISLGVMRFAAIASPRGDDHL